MDDPEVEYRAGSGPPRLAATSIVPQEVYEWAASEGAAIVVPPLTRRNGLGAFAPRVVESWSVSRGVKIRSVQSSIWSMICGVAIVLAVGSILPVFGPMMALPVAAQVVWAGVCTCLAVWGLCWGVAEFRGGPLIEIAGDEVLIPRLGKNLGKASRLAGVVVNVTASVEYDNGWSTTHSNFPVVEFEHSEGRRVMVVLPTNTTGGAAKRLLVRLLADGSGGEPRMVSLRSQKRVRGQAPGFSGD